MIYQLYKKIGFCDNIVQINYGSDGSICEVDGNQIEIWKQLPSGKWIKLHPDLVPGEVVHRKEGRKMLMELLPRQAASGTQEQDELVSVKPVSKVASHSYRKQPYQLRHQPGRQQRQLPQKQPVKALQKRSDQWDEWQGQ